ncbi:preprotein translocase subunit SecG [Polaromonas sp.]|nr:preprotein translocase subunit SecG [Polaromonas sp.]
MNAFSTTLLAVQMISALAMVGLILVQHGKGADMGAAFGSGGSGSLLGASGSANFLSRATGVLATLFFACTLLLAYLGNAQPHTTGASVLEGSALVEPAEPAMGAAQIPATNGPVPSAVPVPAPAVVPASGAAQIPTK